VLIAPESCLRRIPVALDRKQAFFLEGIRVSVEMIDHAHTRLQDTLLAITPTSAQKATPPSEMFTSAMSDAWLVVDAFHRLSDLAQHLPNVVRRMQIPFFHNLIAANDQVNELRNVVQHLPDLIHESPTSPNWSVWGVLSWCVPPDAERGTIYCCSYLCGKLTPGERPFVNPLGRAIRRPVGLITLSQDPISVSLSELFGHTERFAAGLEHMTSEMFRANPTLTETYASDVLVAVTMVEAEETN
jgi:hypothetical protein